MQCVDDPFAFPYNVNNQLTGYNGMTYGYDANGNMTSATGPGGTTSYSYDYENRLVQINFPGGGTATYKYDGQGRRIEKNVNGVITRYLYNGSDPIAEYDGAGVLLAKYLHGRGWGEPLAMQRGSNVYWYHGDGLGSVTEVTDAVEDKVEQYVYDSFGNLHVYDGSGNPLSQTAIGNSFTYIGREYDSESDLYYLRARYYSPVQGRFLARDPLPIVPILDRFFPLNLYLYANNDPVSKKDPSGLLFGLGNCETVGNIEMHVGDYTQRPEFNPGRKMWAESKVSCSKKCAFIQEMVGSYFDNTHPTARVPLISDNTMWGNKRVPMDFSTWVVDSYTESAYYRDQHPSSETTIFMSDFPQVPSNIATYVIMTFRIAVYENNGTHKADKTTGDLNIKDPVGGYYESWYVHFFSNDQGHLEWHGN